MPMTEKDPIGEEKPEWLAQMETVLEVLNDGVIIANETHKILFANSRFLEMTGFSRKKWPHPIPWASFLPKKENI